MSLMTMYKAGMCPFFIADAQVCASSGRPHRCRALVRCIVSFAGIHGAISEPGAVRIAWVAGADITFHPRPSEGPPRERYGANTSGSGARRASLTVFSS